MQDGNNSFRRLRCDQFSTPNVAVPYLWSIYMLLHLVPTKMWSDLCPASELYDVSLSEVNLVVTKLEQRGSFQLVVDT